MEMLYNSFNFILINLLHKLRKSFSHVSIIVIRFLLAIVLISWTGFAELSQCRCFCCDWIVVTCNILAVGNLQHSKVESVGCIACVGFGTSSI